MANQCANCRQTFARPAGLVSHRSGRPNDGSRLSCDNSNCPFWTCGFDSLIHHQWQVHRVRVSRNSLATTAVSPVGGLRPSITCHRCSETFVNNADFSRHVLEHLGGPSNSWHSFQDENLQPFRLLGAEAFPIPEPNDLVVCNSCGVSFDSEQELYHHRTWGGTGSFNPTLSFAPCNQDNSHNRITSHPFSASAQLEADTLPTDLGSSSPSAWFSAHITQENLVPILSPSVLDIAARCDHCQEIFETRAALIKHQATGSDLEEIEIAVIEKKTKCLCGESFPTKAATVDHIRDNNGHPWHLGFCFSCEVAFHDISDFFCHNERRHGYTYPEDFPFQALVSVASGSPQTINQPSSSGQRPNDEARPPGLAGQVRPRPEDEKNATLTCIICLGFPQKLTATGCGHLYCYGCIVPSLRVNAQCPVCRKPTAVTELREIFI